ncbi:MAG: response regulator [Nanoarchaeota archaeon]|nr:response regulator [Nanoarchaeota archaeon]MBU1854309.1 response regulator [Nanoarchaeota archaeon]
MKKVLIIEDEEYIANAEKLILQDEFKVFVAHNGNEGLSMAKRLRPDVIVLDIMLPQMSGYELCQKIRDEKTIANTKVVMVTAKSEQADEDMGKYTGANEYITKPFEPEDLISAVHKVLKKG